MIHDVRSGGTLPQYRWNDDNQRARCNSKTALHHRAHGDLLRHRGDSCFFTLSGEGAEDQSDFAIGVRLSFDHRLLVAEEIPSPQPLSPQGRGEGLSESSVHPISRASRARFRKP